MYKKNVTGNLHKIIATVTDMEVRMLNVSKRTAKPVPLVMEKRDQNHSVEKQSRED